MCLIFFWCHIVRNCTVHNTKLFHGCHVYVHYVLVLTMYWFYPEKCCRKPTVGLSFTSIYCQISSSPISKRPFKVHVHVCRWHARVLTPNNIDFRNEDTRIRKYLAKSQIHYKLINLKYRKARKDSRPTCKNLRNLENQTEINKDMETDENMEERFFQTKEKKEQNRSTKKGKGVY